MPVFSGLRTAAAYVRVSTDDQLEYSPDTQLAKIREYAVREKLLLPDSFIYRDDGISGRSADKRGEFMRMIATARQKPRPFDLILVWKFSRFARSREDSVVYKSMLRKLGVEVVSISEPLSDDNSSIIMEAMYEAMDEFYSANLSGEVKRGMTEAARRGKLLGTAPLGYRVDKGVLIPVPAEADVIRDIFRRFLDGEAIFSIARSLTAAGVRTHRGGQIENRTVEYILQNPVYIGKLRWNPSGRTRRRFDDPNIILSDAAHQPLIDQTDFDAAQALIARRKAAHPWHGKSNPARKSWLSGIVRCSHCGATLTSAWAGTLRCNGYVHSVCRYPQTVKIDDLERQVLSRMETDAVADASQLVFDRIQLSAPPAVDTTRSALVEIRKKLDRLRDAYLSGVESLESYKNVKAALDAEAARLQTELDQQSAEPDDNQCLGILRTSMRSVIRILSDPALSADTKHTAAESIISALTHDRDTGLLSIHYRVLL